ncbi:MAG: hexose kinase [Ilumatobacter sp.]|uniref:1-phosphofructokinase family hexose kinase n=1 Tax=Ilumatobacter sp. TaxID=1967498 RepID=UPI003299EB1A
MSRSRVVTLTFSPALDVATSVDVITPSRKLRCDAPRHEPGGGGINVARVAQRLGADAVAVAPLGGDRGRRVAEQLGKEGVTVEQVIVDHTIRQGFAVTEESTGRQFRFVMPPQRLDRDEADRCVKATCDLASAARCVVVSGSIDLPDVVEVLRCIVQTVRPVPVLIDTSGDALDAALDSGAALIKPSARELADLVGRPLDTESDITAAATDVIARSNVDALLVSIGAGGAVLVRPDVPPLRFRAPTVRVRSTIGAGDSLVAGIATGLADGQELVDAVRLGIAAGTATVLTDGTQLCDPAMVDELLPLVAVDVAVDD